MLAAPVDSLPAPETFRGGAAYEPKFDGYRALVFLDDTGPFIQSRRGSNITTAFPETAAALAEQLPRHLVLDGELVILGPSGALEFESLQRRLGTGPKLAQQLAREHPASLLVFDVLYAAGADLRREPLSTRRQVLEEVMSHSAPPLQLVPQTTDVALARQWMQQYAETAVGIEGVVVKGLAQHYEPGRRGWKKCRVRNTHEVIAAAVTGTMADPGRLIVGLPDDAGNLIVVGGTGDLTPRQATQLRPILARPQGEHPWPEEMPAGRMGRFGGGRVAVTLVDPFVIEVSADQSFEYGKWRHLVRFVRPRPDLGVEEVEKTARR